MIPLRDISIKRKLTIIIMASTLLTLFITGAAFVTYSVVAEKNAMVRDVAILSRVIGKNCTADLVFNDQRSASDTLESLNADSNIMSCVIYRNEGELFAGYFRKDVAKNEVPPSPAVEGFRFGADNLVDFRRIYLDNKPVGMIRLQYDLSELHAAVGRIIEIVIAIMFAVTCVSYLLLSLFQKVISGPILSLADTTKKISQDRNYSIRAEKYGRDEIGLLIDGFNEMLEQIQDRDSKLAIYSEGLEEQVARRTIELKTANDKLQSQITEKLRMEEELFKARQLESLGILAGGIAHDFNNLLTAILGNTSLAKMFAKPGEKIYCRLEDVEKASVRARDLTHQLLTFSKGGAPIKKVTSIAEVIMDTTRFALRGSKSRCEIQIQDDLWPVEVDEGQISQVINNLTINADQAMPGGGVIMVNVMNVTLEKDQVVTLPPGRYIRIAIQDCGMGIPEDQLTKIFTPYFTTKQKGSGLGLATSYSIINKHSGLISVESELGSGTTFLIYLPATEKTVSDREAAAPLVTANCGKILVMDDEELIRNTAGEILSTCGYTVVFADDGAEAVALYREEMAKGSPFDAVVLDLTIPGGMGGVETMQRLIEADPEVRGIVSSGFANGPIMADFKAYGFTGVIAKPYHSEELCRVVNHVIATKPTAGETSR